MCMGAPCLPRLSHQAPGAGAKPGGRREIGLAFCALGRGLEGLGLPVPGPQPHPLGPGWRPWAEPRLLRGLGCPVCETGSSCRLMGSRWGQEGGLGPGGAQKCQPAPLPRARPRQAAQSAAPVRSAACTCTWCSDTWLTGSSTTAAASGVNIVPTRCTRAATEPQRSPASSSVPATPPKPPL